MESANKIPFCFAGYNAFDIKWVVPVPMARAKSGRARIRSNPMSCLWPHAFHQRVYGRPVERKTGALRDDPFGKVNQPDPAFATKLSLVFWLCQFHDAIIASPQAFIGDREFCAPVCKPTGGCQMPQDKMADYIETQNIAYYKTLLETEAHPDKRKTLIELLAQEEAKHAARIAGARSA
jgi:hypothetical protein